MAKAIDPVLISGLIEKCKEKYLSDIESAEGKAKYLKELEHPTLDMFEFENDFKYLFLPCIMDEDCMGETVRIDNKYVYFKVDESKASQVLGVDADAYLFNMIFKPMSERLRLMTVKISIDNTWKYGYYIRYDPVKHCEAGINQCFDIVVTMANRLCDYLPELTNLFWLEAHHSPCLDFVRSQYKNFANYASGKTTQIIRQNLLQDIGGDVIFSKLKGNTYFQSVIDRDISKNQVNYVVQNWQKRINNKETIRWYEIYDNLMVALN